MANPLVIKSVVKLASSKEGRKLIGAIAGFIIAILVLAVGAVAGAISIFTGESEITGDFNARQTQIYTQIREIYADYVLEEQEEIDDIEERLRRENTAYRRIEVYNPETRRMEYEWEEYCRAQIFKSYQKIPTAYVMAYLSCVHQVLYSNTRSVNVSEGELIDFWDNISEITITRSGPDDTPSFYIKNEILTLEEIAGIYFSTEEEQQYFFFSEHIIAQFIGSEEEMNSVAEGRMDIPLYYQYAAPWGTQSYGDGNIASSGCAPTCIAMVFSYLRGSNISPGDVVDFTGNRYHVRGRGSSWDIFGACASQWGVHCTNIGRSEQAIISALENGQPVILSMGPGTFASSGHFIVLTGIDENRTVTVNDPNDNSRKNHIGRRFSIEQIVREAKGGWSFEG